MQNNFKELTVDQRLFVYKEMLKNLKELPVHPPCKNKYGLSDWKINLCFCRQLALINAGIHLQDLPELMAHKPEEAWNGGFWFDPFDRIRIKILETIIFKMEHPIKAWFRNLF